jgi:hypothetical protein
VAAQFALTEGAARRRLAVISIALVLVALTALPPALVLVAGGGWLAVPAGVAAGVVLAAWLGRLAVARLADRQVEILHTLTAPA